MVKHFGVAALVGMAMLLPATSLKAEHGHGHGGHGHGGHGHGGHGHGHGHGHFGGHGHGFGIHIGGGHYHHYGNHRHHGWSYVLPHYDRYYHGTYYLDRGYNYYVPRTYVTDPGTYVAAKPVQIEFGGYARVDDLSGRLERLTNQLCLDLHYNYRHNPGFAETYRAAYQVLDTAKYIHAKEHQGDREEVARRLDEVDGLFHVVQDQVKGWSRRHYRQVGQAGAQTKVELVEATLHHLMNDVGVKGSHGAPEPSSAPAAEETAPPPEPEASAPVTLPPPAN